MPARTEHLCGAQRSFGQAPGLQRGFRRCRARCLSPAVPSPVPGVGLSPLPARPGPRGAVLDRRRPRALPGLPRAPLLRPTADAKTPMCA